MRINKLKATMLIIVAVGIVLGMASAGIYAALTASQTVPVTGAVSAVNLAVQQNGQTLTALNFDSVDAGSTTTQTVTVQDTGNVPETLSLTTNSLTPAGCGITLTWDQQGTVLTAGQSVTATLTLTVPSAISSGTNFSFNTVFTGTES